MVGDPRFMQRQPPEVLEGLELMLEGKNDEKWCKCHNAFSSDLIAHDQKETADLVTFTGEILNGKLHFLCSANGINFIPLL